MQLPNEKSVILPYEEHAALKQKADDYDKVAAAILNDKPVFVYKEVGGYMPTDCSMAPRRSDAIANFQIKAYDQLLHVLKDNASLSKVAYGRMLDARKSRHAATRDGYEEALMDTWKQRAKSSDMEASSAIRACRGLQEEVTHLTNELSSRNWTLSLTSSIAGAFLTWLIM